VSELPFLIVYGAWVWKVLLVVIPVAIVATRWALSLRRLTVAARAAVAAALARRATRLAEGEIVVVGTLRDDAVECGGERIAFDGSITVPHGEPPDEGDDVIVQGVLVRRADASTGRDYRTAAGGWVMTGAIAMTAVRPRVRTPSTGMLRTALTLAAAGAVTYGSLCCVGSAALGDMYDAEDDVPSLAAAMPNTREDALEELEWRLEHAGADELGAWLALADLRRGCAGRVQVLRTTEHLDDAYALATRCGLQAEAWEALVLLGRYDDAFSLGYRGADSMLEARAAIGAGRWREAAAALGRAARVNETLAAAEDDATDALVLRKAANRYRCIAQLARAHAGESDATERVLELQRAPSGGWCEVVAAELGPVELRRDRWLAIVDNRGFEYRIDYPAVLAAQELAWADGVPLDRGLAAEGAIAALDGPDMNLVAWLAPWAVAAQRRLDDPDALAAALGWYAVVANARGDHTVAASAADEAVMLAHTPDAGATAERVAAAVKARPRDDRTSWRAHANALADRDRAVAMLLLLR
jgi:hypothetical protein